MIEDIPIPESVNGDQGMSKLPFSTNNGYFHGDMFEDWYSSKPTEEDEKFWLFLHNWEKQMETRLLNELMEKFIAFAKSGGKL